MPERDTPVPDAAWEELQAAVHEEVCKLPDRLRLPFVLCTLQGRPQKEAAAVLGWKVASVSSRLTEARRRLLDRLARRGVPVGVAAGAAVLGGVAGRAAVPPSISAKVLSAAGDPAAVSEPVLSLARGVTPMYLTRTKLLAAGLLLAGALTTGLALSKADAQAPPSGRSPEAVQRALDYLRTHQAPRDQWEYKFVPVEKALTTADLQQVLAGADREGWAYCGSQDLVREKSGKAASHMVFKRPRAAGVAGGDADAAAALAAELADRERAVREAVYARRVAAAQHELVARDDKEAADKAAAQERDRVRAAEAQAAANKALAERAVRDAQDRDARLKELEAVKADYEALIRKLRAEAKGKAAPPAGKPEPQASANDPKKGGEDDRAGGEKGAPTAIRLRHAQAADVARVAEKLLSGSGGRVTFDAATNTVFVAGPAGAVADVEKVVAALDAGPERPK